MNKGILSVLPRTIYILLAITTVIVLFIVYKDIDNEIAYNFVVGYVFFAFFTLLYFPIIVILKLKRLKWTEIRKRLLNFTILFLSFSIAVYVFNYFFRPSDIDLLGHLFTSFGLAFGSTFIDVIFLKHKDN